MKTLWLLTWRGMKKRKAGTLLLGGAVALSAMFLTLVALVGLSSVKTAVENAKDTYGEQMVVATGMDAAAQSLLHNDAFLRKGAMLLSGSVTVENNAAAVLVGYADEAARGMARIRLLDGRLPEAPGEIALERAAAFRLNAELGGTVTAAVTLAEVARHIKRQELFMIRSLDIVECEVLPVVARLEVSVRRGQIGNPLRSEAAVDVGNFAGRLVALSLIHI